MAPLAVRLAAGAYALVTADEVRDLLGCSRERATAILGRVPPVQAGTRGRKMWRWGRVVDAMESEPEPRAAPVALTLADVKPRRPRGR